MKFSITQDIQVVLFSRELASTFFEAIHETYDPKDKYRCRLQAKYDQLEKVKARLEDAIANKYEIDGSPDFFIFHRGKLAGIFEFHPLTAEDFVEVGYWLFAKYQQKGILTSVFPFMIDYAKNAFLSSLMLATTDVENIPSQKLLEKVNFKKTGRILEFQQESGIITKEIEYIYPLKVEK